MAEAHRNKKQGQGMSEAVTNAEIEDVLSSIRRLVSENAGAEPQGEAAAPLTTVPPVAPEAAAPVAPVTPEPAAPEPAPIDKLVLTPAFRVHDGGQGHDVPSASQGAKPEPVLLSDPLPDTPEIAPEIAPETAQGEAEGAEAAAKATLPDWEAGAAVEIDESADWSEVSGALEDVVAPAEAEDLESRIAELEAVIGEAPGEWEPDGSEEEVEEPQTVVFEHAAWSARRENLAPQEAEVVEEPVAEPVEAVEESASEEGDTLFDAGFEEALIDEEVLREMVQKLVREELQGTVGERITRNVRRLVRREIQRALTLREFE